jgi:exo-beta-1,3-glucanase (GH17 family)
MAPVAAECDFIGLNSHAYWGGVDPTTRRSGKHVADGARQVAEKWGKPCIITETGYPTVGEPHETVDGIAETGLSRQTLFLSDMEVESRSQNLAVYMFEPFDGDWKRRWAPYVEMDYSFGFAKCDRTMKDVQFPPLGAW